MNRRFGLLAGCAFGFVVVSQSPALAQMRECYDCKTPECPDLDAPACPSSAKPADGGTGKQKKPKKSSPKVLPTPVEKPADVPANQIGTKPSTDTNPTTTDPGEKPGTDQAGTNAAAAPPAGPAGPGRTDLPGASAGTKAAPVAPFSPGGTITKDGGRYKTYTRAGVTTLAGGAVLAIGGVVLLALDGRFGRSCDGSGNDPGETCQELLRTQTPGAVLVSAGGVSMITGGILLGLRRR